MRYEIIPAILTKSQKQFEQRLSLASQLADTVQIDIMDGLFVDNETPRGLKDGRWFGAYLLQGPERVPDIELHLMVMDPWSIIREWQAYAKLKRAIWHVELPIEHGALIERLHDLGIEAGLAVNPETPPEALKPYLPTARRKTNMKDCFADEILVMGVHPGFSGQKFIPTGLQTVRDLRHRHPHLAIGVDGHVGLDTINDILQAGADRLNIGGAIFRAAEPELAYQALADRIDRGTKRPKRTKTSV